MATAKKTPAKKPVATKKPTKGKGGPKNIDWFQARALYLTDNTVSYADIAKKYGVTKKAVEDRAKKETWAKLRQDLGEKAFTAFQEKLLDTKESAQNRHLLQYQNLQGLANKAIGILAEHSYATDIKGRLVLNEKGKPIPQAPNPFQLEKLAKTMQIAMNGERVVLGLPTSVGAITDPEGGNPWGGLADMLLAAREVNKNAAKRADSSGDSRSNTE
jgi:hypothetical protein